MAAPRARGADRRYRCRDDRGGQCAGDAGHSGFVESGVAALECPDATGEGEVEGGHRGRQGEVLHPSAEGGKHPGGDPISAVASAIPEADRSTTQDVARPTREATAQAATPRAPPISSTRIPARSGSASTTRCRRADTLSATVAFWEKRSGNLLPGNPGQRHELANTHVGHLAVGDGRGELLGLSPSLPP